MENEIYNPPAYFLNQYEADWITSDLSKKMILDVDITIIRGDSATGKTTLIYMLQQYEADGESSAQNTSL